MEIQSGWKQTPTTQPKASQNSTDMSGQGIWKDYPSPSKISGELQWNSTSYNHTSSMELTPNACSSISNLASSKKTQHSSGHGCTTRRRSTYSTEKAWHGSSTTQPSPTPEHNITGEMKKPSMLPLSLHLPPTNPSRISKQQQSTDTFTAGSLEDWS